MRVFLLRKGEGKEGTYKLTAKERNYLFRVLRLNVNDVFTAKDGKEVFYRAFLFDEDTITLERTDSPEETLLDGLSSYTGPFVPLDAFIAVLKGKKNERVVRDVQEAGVERTTFISTEFTSSSEIKKHDMERLEAIRREAVQQSGAKVMELGEVMTFEEAIEKAEGKILILHQSTRGKTKSIIEALKDVEKDDVISVFIGSEGGFSDHECEKAEERNAIPVLLKTNILRAENASIYTISAVQTLLNE